jgi:hypothetical protein
MTSDVPFEVTIAKFGIFLLVCLLILTAWSWDGAVNCTGPVQQRLRNLAGECARLWGMMALAIVTIAMTHGIFG